MQVETAALTVTQLTRHIKALLEADDILQDVVVRGEVANFKRHSSGHLYFSLRDENSQMPCVMFAGPARFLAFAPEDGLRVLARGHITVYEPRGQYQLYVESMQYDGLGALFEALERLKRKLEAEGLFEPARKRPLPPFPHTIGLVTSDKGAAVRDMITILGRRWPLTQVLVFPTTVQGAEAPPSIVNSLALASRFPGLDLIILGRGGGSLEDLWAFNTEEVVRAVAACRIPVVSAVGHETDWSLTDFAADLRAPTPSAAAELVVPDHRELGRELESILARLRSRLEGWVARQQEALAAVGVARLTTAFGHMLDDWTQQCDEMRTGIDWTMARRLEARVAALTTEAARLNAVNPLAVLRRGYSVLRLRDTKTVVRSVRQVKGGDETEALVTDGSVAMKVVATKEENHGAQIANP